MQEQDGVIVFHLFPSIFHLNVVVKNREFCGRMAGSAGKLPVLEHGNKYVKIHQAMRT
jgi:hypothetical protein